MIPTAGNNPFVPGSWGKKRISKSMILRDEKMAGGHQNAKRQLYGRTGKK
jgi:hypothetical protein